ncbi:Alpha/Beta hydrolase protein [Suillus placidus]|uniref:Carboxylic ester hydrolase n=1 Tax=Suillus placidus TaxID=48579 RepID=A0A9P7D6S4_9AGAM|nr:Alpha/Beta hydrolase protein [Suillus placidus]
MTAGGYDGPPVSTFYIFGWDELDLIRRVVLVTMNYRLTTLGWHFVPGICLHHDLISLQWMQDNIEAFGGDPPKLLIYGESAGGYMTRYLLGTNPKYTERPLHEFTTSNPFSSPELALTTSLRLVKYCVTNTSAGDLAIASHNLGIVWAIVVDGDYIPNVIASSLICEYCHFLPTTLAPVFLRNCYV